MATKKTQDNWYRRVVPEGYATATLTLKGTSPLLMNSGEADRDSELYRAYFMLGQKKRKSLDDEARLRELEWKLRIYLDKDLGPYIPGKNVKEMLRNAATKWRRGEDIKRSLIVVSYRIPLQYDGPRDEVGLWEAGFRYTAMVANAGFNAGRVARCRPMFKDWTIETELAFDPEDIDADFLTMVVERSEKYGLGDYRPEFGSFTALLNGEAVHKPHVQGSAIKSTNGHDEQAHEAFKARILVSSET
jgi:hypothetical protein